MKKFLLSLAAAALCTSAMATTVTYECNSLGETTINQIEKITVGDVTFSFGKGEGQTPPAYNKAGDIRLYAKNVMTVTAATGVNVTEVKFTLADVSQYATITASTGTLSTQAAGDTELTWTGDANTFTLTVGEKADFGSDTNKAGQLRFNKVEVTYIGEGGGTTDPDPGTGEEPGEEPGESDGNIVQKLDKGLGFPESKAEATEAASYTATDTNIEYTLMGCYTNPGYLFVNGKDFAGAYISWSLDMDMSNLIMATSGSCSTNAASTVNVYANDNLIGNYQVNELNAKVVVEIPESYQKAGTVYKVESGTDKYNQQFVSFTYVKAGNEVEIPEPDVPAETLTVTECIALVESGYTGPATVKGIVSQVDKFDSKYNSITYWISDDGTTDNQMQVYSGLGLDKANFTSIDDVEVGAKVEVTGNVKIFNSTVEFDYNNYLLSYEAPEGGDNPGGETPEQPAGNVTQPFTTGIGFAEKAADAPAVDTQYTATNTGITYNVMGCYTNSGYLMVNGKNFEGAYISWSLDFDMSQLQMVTTSGGSTNEASAVNIYANDQLIEENYVVNKQNETYIIEIPEAYQGAGTVYKVESATTKYNQQFASFTYIKAGNEVENPKPEVPDAPEGVISVAEALDLIQNGYTGPAQVKGYISSIKEVSTQYGNATYYIVDELNSGDAELGVYRGYGLNGDQFTAEDEIEVGALVTVEGTLVNFQGNTPQFTTGSKILDYQAPQGEEPGPGEDGKELNVTFDFTDPASLNDEFTGDAEDGEYDLNGVSLTNQDVTLSFYAPEDASNAPRLFYGSGTNAGWTLRFYKDNTFTVSVKEGDTLVKIEFDGNNVGKDWTMSEGELSGNTWTATEATSSVEFGKSATGNSPAIRTMTVYYKQGGELDAIEIIEAADDSEAVYYNLQGVRVQNPVRGIYVKVQNGKATKVLK